MHPRDASHAWSPYCPFDPPIVELGVSMSARVHNRRHARINTRISMRSCLYIGAFFFRRGRYVPAKLPAAIAFPRGTHARTHAETHEVDAIVSFYFCFSVPFFAVLSFSFLPSFFSCQFLRYSPPTCSVPALLLGLSLSVSGEFSCGSAILKRRFPGIFARRAKRRK